MGLGTLWDLESNKGIRSALKCEFRVRSAIKQGVLIRFGYIWCAANYCAVIIALRATSLCSGRENAVILRKKKSAGYCLKANEYIVGWETVLWKIKAKWKIRGRDDMKGNNLWKIINSRNKTNRRSRRYRGTSSKMNIRDDFVFLYYFHYHNYLSL